MLVVYKLDRLGRSTFKLLGLTEELQRRGVEFVSLKDQINTTSAIGKAMFRMLAVLAEMERELTVERIRERMAKAKRYGTRSDRPKGRPQRKIPASFKKYYPMWKDGDITATDFARLIGVIRPTHYQYIKEYKTG